MSVTWGRMAAGQARFVGDVGVRGPDPAHRRVEVGEAVLATQAATSAPKPLVSTSSWTTSIRPVRATDWRPGLCPTARAIAGR